MKRVITYKGFTITIWEKSFRVDGLPVVWLGAKPEEFAENLERTITYVLRTWLRRFIKGEQ